MPLGECLRRTTHRQFMVWNVWLGEQWNIPDRTDSYLAQIACEVRRGASSKPKSVKIDQFILKFDDPKGRKNVTREQAANASKAKWVGMMTKTVVHCTKPNEEVVS